MKIFIFHTDAQFHHLPFMHSSDTYCAFSSLPFATDWDSKTTALEEIPLTSLSHKQGGKTQHLLKNLHFLQKVGAGFSLWAAIFLTPLSHKMGVKTEVLFENFSKIFWENKKPGTKGYHITSRWSASLCGKLLRPAIWWFHITSLGSNVPRCSVTTKSLIRRFLGSFSCACIIANRCSLVNRWWNLFRYLWLWRR